MTGGRLGGGSFSSPSRVGGSGSSSSRSYSAPSSSSYSRSYSVPPTRSYSTPPPPRSISAPPSTSYSRSYSAPPSPSYSGSISTPSSPRSYSAPSSSYSAPSSSSYSRSYSAPSSLSYSDSAPLAASSSHTDLAPPSPSSYSRSDAVPSSPSNSRYDSAPASSSDSRYSSAPSSSSTSRHDSGPTSSKPRSDSASSSPSDDSRSNAARSYDLGFSQGYATGYLSQPTVPITAPLVPQSTYAGGAGAVANRRGPSLLNLFLLGFLVLAMSAQAQRILEEKAAAKVTSEYTSALGSGISVVQLSVALEIPNRDDPQSMLSVMNRLAETARTDSRVGLSNLTSQVALELLRRKSSIVSASSSYQHFNDRNTAEREFQSLAIKERGKFETETVSKYAGVDYSNSVDSTRLSGGSDSSSPQATMAVVTLVLAIDGDSTKLSTIRTMANVEDALRKIASDVKVDDCLQSCEILWTPEDRGETLTLGNVVAEYPELRTVQ